MAVEIAICVLALLLAFLFFVSFRSKKAGNLPPGPQGLPFIGNLLSLDPLQHKTFDKWASAYGPIFSCTFLGRTTIVISKQEMWKELCSELNMVGQSGAEAFDFVGNGKVRGVVNTNGRHWEEVHNFTVRKLREFGLGKQELEPLIMTELNHLLDHLISEGKNGTISIQDMKRQFFFFTVNPIWRIGCGKRLDMAKDKPLLDLSFRALKYMSELMQSMPGALLFYLPEFSRKYIPSISKHNTTRKLLVEFKSYFENIIESQTKELDKTGEVETFFQAFIQKIRETKDEGSVFHGNLGAENLIGIVGDFYTAASDSTASTLAWMILYLTKLPHIQRKFHQEIDKVVGDERQVNLSDRKRMPYAEALIAEVLRYSTVGAFGVQHEALEEKENFHGYYIPKGAILVGNLYHMHFSEKVWEDPQNFRPERFLHGDGDNVEFKKNELLVAFSAGKRLCLGEPLAMDMLFLFATNMFQKFSFTLDATAPVPDFEPAISFNLSPKPYRVFAKCRKMLP